MGVMSPLLLVVAAHAFSPQVHRAMAERALAVEAAEAGGAALIAEAWRFPVAAAGEDWNLVRKWGRWHHYWHDAPLAWRRPSAERVAMLEEALGVALAEGDRARAWVLAGYAAHHVQDMASPPHVVPVAHGLGDGFERYDVAGIVAGATGGEGVDVGTEAARVVGGDRGGGVDGGVDGAVDGGVDVGTEAARVVGAGRGVEERGGVRLVELQRAVAAATVAALAEPLACEGGPLPWTRFWEPRPGRFGRLGALRFGAVDGCEAGTLAFVRARVEAAVAYTRAIVRWVAAGG